MKKSRYFHRLNQGYNPYSESMIWFKPQQIIDIDINNHAPGIDIELEKINHGKLAELPSPSRNSLKSIPKTTFEKYFNSVLNQIKSADWGGQGEYYYIIHQEGWIEIILFTTDTKKQFNIHIDFRNFADFLSLSLRKSSSFSRRKGYRKNGIAISEEQFKLALKFILEFIQDIDSYRTNADRLEDKLKQILAEDIRVDQDLKITGSQEFIMQIVQKQKQLQKRLMENDTDTLIERATLRGELEGLEYALRAYFLLTGE